MSSHINPDSGTLVIESTNVLDVNAADLNLASTTSALCVRGGAGILDNLYVGGTLVVNGNVISLGNAGGSLTLNANVNSNVVPNTDSGIQYDLGTNSSPWDIAFLQKVVSVKTSATNSVSLSTSGTVYLNASTSTALTLADGIEGERKILVVTDTPSSTIVVTPDTFLNGTDISFVTIGQCAEFIFTESGWAILSLYGNPSVN
jgi:hypothetical protein